MPVTKEGYLSTTVNDNNWINNLADVSIKADLSKFTTAGALSYTSALQLLTDVGSDGKLTSVEFGDLQTVAAHLNGGLATTSYIASIFDQLVLGSPANVSWNGGSATAVALGNLHAGSSITQFNELIGKWFLGTDLPDATLHDLPASTPQPHYGAIGTPLFGAGGAPTVHDIAQGAAGDCELCAGLIEMVENHADLAQSMIVDNGNNTYGVRFYINGNEDWVTVNNVLPGFSYGLTYTKNGLPQNPALWAALVEKAYVQLSETGLIGHPALNSYSNIWNDAPSDIFGNLVNASGVKYYFSNSSSWNSSKAAIIAAIANHQDVVLETPTEFTPLHNSQGLETLVPNHAHAVIGYDEQSGNFIVRNPWGEQQNQNWVTEFKVSMDTIAAVGGDFVIASSSQSVIDVGTGRHNVNGGAALAVAQMFSVKNPDGLPVSEYLLQLNGRGTVLLNGAHNLATPAQLALGQVLVSAADLAKIYYAAPTGATGSADLSVSALLGQVWTRPGDVLLNYHAGATATLDSVVLSNAHNLLAADSTVSLASLFTVSGAQPYATYYAIYLGAGNGTLDLHGVKNYTVNGETTGNYQIAAADLASITFALGANANAATLQVAAYTGNGWTSYQDVAIHRSVGIATAMQAYANGQLATAAHVLDSAEQVFANLAWAQTALDHNSLQAIVLTDSGTPALSLTGSALAACRGVLNLIDGRYTLAVSNLSVADATSLPDPLLSHVSSFSVLSKAADIVTNLGALQALAGTGKLTALHFSDSGTPHLTLTSDQLVSAGTLLQLLDGAYQLTVSGSAAAIAAGIGNLPATPHTDFVVRDSAANVLSQLDALQALAAAGKLGSIALTDSSTPTLLLTPAQLSSDAAALSKLSGIFKLALSSPLTADAALLPVTGALAAIAVADSAAQVGAHLDALQALYASGKLYSLSLTDGGTPTITLSAAQLAADTPLLHAITEPYTVSVKGISNGVAHFLIEQNATGRNGTPVLAVSGTTPLPPGSNGAIGFKSATFSNGYNAVALDNARSHYALQLDADDKLIIKDIDHSDSNYGQSVTVTGANYVLFDAASTDSKGNFTSMYFVANSQNAAIAELYAATFGRQPDLAGLEFWENHMANDMTLQTIAANFVNSDEFKAHFAAASLPSDHGGASDAAFVRTLYENVLHRAPEAAGLSYWLNSMAHDNTRANMLISFALSAENIANTNASAGHAGGWLIDTSKGGYADDSALLDAALAMRQGLDHAYLNTALIDSSTVGNGVTAGAESLKGGVLTVGAALAAQNILLSTGVNTVVINNSGNQIAGTGSATITIHSSGNTVHLSGADHLDLLGGSATTVFNFTPGSGATLHLAPANAASSLTLLADGGSGPLQGASLSFDGGNAYVMDIGSIGDGSAVAAATAINKAYAVASRASEALTFIGVDNNGNTEAWRFGSASASGADHNGNHLVDAGELVQMATLIGVATHLAAADFG